MDSHKTESSCSLSTEMERKSSAEEPVCDEGVQLERFDSLDSFRTRASTESRTVSMASTESYETVRFFLFVLVRNHLPAFIS